MAKAATLRSAPAIEVAMLRSGRVLQRSKNRFDSPMATEHEVLTAWNGLAEALREYGDQEDRDLAHEMSNFKESMPTLLRARQKHRQRWKEIGQESERQEELARQREIQMGRKGPSLER